MDVLSASQLDHRIAWHENNSATSIVHQPSFSGISLYNNYPNPFNPLTTIEYDLPVLSEVLLIIYDVVSRGVNKLVSTSQTAGRYNGTWDGTDHSIKQLAGGMYFARLLAGEYSSAVKTAYLRQGNTSGRFSL